MTRTEQIAVHIERHDKILAEYVSSTVQENLDSIQLVKAQWTAFMLEQRKLAELGRVQVKI
jgi:hypothetical protein